MSSNTLLIIIVSIFWLSWLLLAVAYNRSWVHVIALFPWAMIIVGVSVNYIFNWVGTILIICLHGGIIGRMLYDLLRKKGLQM